MGHLYDERFMDYTDRSSRHAARRIIDLLAPALKPASVLDIGCARGTWLSEWAMLGNMDIAGVDGDYVDRAALAISRDAFTSADLSQPLDLGRPFDLVQSLEVAEHIPASAADTFVANIARHSRGLVLFSAAPPGQGGEFHVNEQPYDYWRDKFAARGFDAYDCIRPQIAGDASISFWYRFNLLLYVHRDHAGALPPEIAVARIPDGTPVTDVSPPVFRLRKAVVSRLPYALQQTLARFKARVLPSGRF